MKRAIMISAAAAAFLFILGIVSGFAETVTGATIRVIDGDTVELSDGERIRLLTIDAPEVRGARCRSEADAGRRATERLEELLRSRSIEVKRSGRKDRYGRTLARLETDIGDVGLILLAESHAILWRPGPAEKAKRTAFWCGGSER